MKVNFLDYKGATLTESTEDGGSDRQELMETINRSSALIMTLSYSMVNGAMAGNYNATRLLRRYLKVIQDCRAEGGRNIPIILMLTMADCYKEGTLEDVYSFLTESIFLPCFQKGDQWLLMIVPVSLGDLGEPNLDKGAGQSIEGKIDPVNLHLPVLFSVYAHITDILRISENDLNRLKARRSSFSDKLYDENRKNLIILLFNQSERKALRNQIDKYASRIEGLSSKVENLKRDLDRIVYELFKKDDRGEQPCRIYFDGEELQRG